MSSIGRVFTRAEIMAPWPRRSWENRAGFWKMPCSEGPQTAGLAQRSGVRCLYRSRIFCRWADGSWDRSLRPCGRRNEPLIPFRYPSCRWGRSCASIVGATRLHLVDGAGIFSNRLARTLTDEHGLVVGDAITVQKRALNLFVDA